MPDITTDLQLSSLIEKRWSPRAFSEQTVSKEQVDMLLQAACLAFSSMNEQPWRYLVAHRGSPLFDQMVDCLNPGNQTWAKEAPVLMLSLAKTNFGRNGNPNRHAWHDVGAANMNLALQATSMDLYTHLMGGYDREKTLNTFSLEETLEPVVFIALGYLGDPDQLEEPLRSRERASRKRKPLDEILIDVPAQGFRD